MNVGHLNRRSNRLFPTPSVGEQLASAGAIARSEARRFSRSKLLQGPATQAAPCNQGWVSLVCMTATFTGACITVCALWNAFSHARRDDCFVVDLPSRYDVPL